MSVLGCLKLQSNQLSFLAAHMLSCRPGEMVIAVFTADLYCAMEKSSSLFSSSCKLAGPIQLLVYAKWKILRWIKRILGENSLRKEKMEGIQW